MEKMAVLTAIRRRGGVISEDKRRAIVRGRRSHVCGALTYMANIQSQIKRNQRALRERFENRHYTSAIKTYFRRLEAAVAEGDDTRADVEHRQLVKLIDKAVKRGALHRNNGARKKSRAARLRRGEQAAS
jgi:small subunit ribosomal protein S20